MVSSFAFSEPLTAKIRYDEAMTELKSAKDEYSRWCALNAAAKESLNTGHDSDARSFAEELEQLAQKYTHDWNYGNAIQDYNIVLGRLALKANDVKEAKRRLLAAGRSPGSPQLDSFGPNMALAKELLTRGERSVVLEYLELCRKFWARNPNTNALDKKNSEQLDRWKREIVSGRIPDFGTNLYY